MSREGLFLSRVGGWVALTGLLGEVGGDCAIVAIDPGNAVNRVWVTDRDGLVGEPLSLPTSRAGLDRLGVLLGGHELPVFAVEATGSLHRAWAAELERRWPGSLRLFAPSETQAARAQLGTRGLKTDDRDCAALVWLARQGAGRPAVASGVEAMLAAVAHSPPVDPRALPRCASACTISSTRLRPASRRRRCAGERCCSTRPRAMRSWRARPRSPAGRRARAR